jgi:hypothetical protein
MFPKIVRPGTEAKVVRKWIEGLPPRTLLVLLPNQVMVAYDSASGQVLKAWKSAWLTKPHRSTAAVRKSLLPRGRKSPVPSKPFCRARNLASNPMSLQGDSVFISTLVDGVSQNFKVSPDGSDSFSISVQ